MSIEGKRFAVEVHFVDAGTDGLAVIGVLIFIAGGPSTLAYVEKVRSQFRSLRQTMRAPLSRYFCK
jgi:carbonic anhydrase